MKHYPEAPRPAPPPPAPPARNTMEAVDRVIENALRRRVAELEAQLAECQRQLEAERAGAERRIGAIRDYAEYRADYSAIARGIIKLLDSDGYPTLG